MIKPTHRSRRLIAVAVALAPVAVWADGGGASTVDRIITIVSSIAVPILLALLGHRLGEARKGKAEEKVRAKSVFVPPPQPRTALNWLAEIGNVAAPASQLVAPTHNRRTWMPVAVAAALIGIGVITGVLVSRLVGSGDRPASAAAASAAKTDGFKMFVDRGQYFVRAGTADGLAMGASVAVLDDKGAAAAEGAVVEVWGHVARLNVEPAPPAGAVLRASFTVSPPPVAAAAPPALPGAPRAPRPAAPTLSREAPPVAGLRGEASISGFGPAKRLKISNTGSAAWTRCELRLPSNKRYLLDALAAGASDGVMLVKFSQDGVERDVEPTSINITCAEGTARLSIR